MIIYLKVASRNTCYYSEMISNMKVMYLNIQHVGFRLIQVFCELFGFLLQRLQNFNLGSIVLDITIDIRNCITNRTNIKYCTSNLGSVFTDVFLNFGKEEILKMEQIALIQSHQKIPSQLLCAVLMNLEVG